MCPGVNLPTFFEEPAAPSYRVDLKVEVACVSETYKFAPLYVALYLRRHFFVII